MLNINAFDSNSLLQKVSDESFFGTPRKVEAHLSDFFYIFQTYAAQLSYIYNDSQERKQASRVRKYFNHLNSMLTGACLGRGMLVAHKLFHTKDKTIDFEENAHALTITLIQYLFNSISPGLHALQSINHKISFGSHLCSEMLLGLKPLEHQRFELCVPLEEILEKHLHHNCHLIGLKISFSSIEQHAIFFMTDPITQGYYLIDSNFPLIQFKSMKDLRSLGPQLIRSLYSHTNEISDNQLIKLGLKNYKTKNKFPFNCIGFYSFQKVDFFSNSNKVRQLTEYTKAIWLLPYEKEQDFGNALWKIKIQRIIYLVKNCINSSNQLPSPFLLSPLSCKGVKDKIIETIQENPIQISYYDQKHINQTIHEIFELKVDENNLNFCHTVFTLLKKKFSHLKTTTEQNKEVIQFRFDDCLSGLPTPLL